MIVRVRGKTRRPELRASVRRVENEDGGEDDVMFGNRRPPLLSPAVAVIQVRMGMVALSP